MAFLSMRNMFISHAMQCAPDWEPVAVVPAAAVKVFLHATASASASAVAAGSAFQPAAAALQLHLHQQSIPPLHAAAAAVSFQQVPAAVVNTAHRTPADHAYPQRGGHKHGADDCNTHSAGDRSMSEGLTTGSKTSRSAGSSSGSAGMSTGGFYHHHHHAHHNSSSAPGTASSSPSVSVSSSSSSEGNDDEMNSSDVDELADLPLTLPRGANKKKKVTTAAASTTVAAMVLSPSKKIDPADFAAEKRYRVPGHSDVWYSTGLVDNYWSAAATTSTISTTSTASAASVTTAAGGGGGGGKRTGGVATANTTTTSGRGGAKESPTRAQQCREFVQYDWPVMRGNLSWRCVWINTKEAYVPPLVSLRGTTLQLKTTELIEVSAVKQRMSGDLT